MQIQRAIIDKRSQQLKMDFSLWHRAAVMQLIKQDYGHKLPVRTVEIPQTLWLHSAKTDQKSL